MSSTVETEIDDRGFGGVVTLGATFGTAGFLFSSLLIRFGFADAK